jgi:hypothetical protein
MVMLGQALAFAKIDLAGGVYTKKRIDGAYF